MTARWSLAALELAWLQLNSHLLRARADANELCKRCSVRRHTSRFLVIFLTFLPFALWESCQWLTPAVTGVVAFLLIGVENIGIQIEQPFSVLPLELFCGVVQANAAEVLQVWLAPCAKRGVGKALMSGFHKANLGHN